MRSASCSWATSQPKPVEAAMMNITTAVMRIARRITSGNCRQVMRFSMNTPTSRL